MSAELQRVDRAAQLLRERVGDDRVAGLRLGIVLGSGLKSFAETLEDALEVPFGDVPEWPQPQVEGHGGAVVFGRIGAAGVAVLTGRVHLYEGHAPADAVRCVRTLRQLGVPRFLLTNAAGGIGDGYAAGDLMALTDHLNLTGQTPLLGEHVAAFGPRFPDQSTVYDPELRAELLSSAADRGADLRQGVYAGLLGPSYETPAEIRMLRTLGADAVGMSTVHEAMALNAMGAKVCGMSLITNLAAGISARPLSHDEVIETGRNAQQVMTDVVGEFCRRQA